MSTISLLGSTGSIGIQTLEVCGLLGIGVCGIAAHRNVTLLERQARRYSPALVAVYDEAAARDLKARLSDTPSRVVSGPEGLVEAAAAPWADTVVTAVVGTAGLVPTLAAIDLGRRIALANKETLVCAGELVMSRAGERGAEIIPVDSEHSAIFQCLRGGETIKRIILTASGGPFHGMTLRELEGVTPEMALKHPTWSMGAKITVDCATMMNKGLEFIEAMHLFSLSPEQIEVLVHPQSVIHSMVEYVDGSVLAQLGVPDMRLPIQYALTYPERRSSLTETLDLTRLDGLTFSKPDYDAFRCLRLAIDTAGRRGTACAVLSAANEAAVELFLQGRIGFNRIYESVLYALDNIENIESPSLDDILASDGEARRLVYEGAKA